MSTARLLPAVVAIAFSTLACDGFTQSPTELDVGSGSVTKRAHRARGTTGDFTGDRYADYADHDLSNGRFWVHENLRDGRFAGTGDNWGTGQTSTGGETFVCDFTGDGFADYADHDLSNGRFWVHENLRNGDFRGTGDNWGIGQTAAGSSWQTLLGDFTGDGFCDYADHDLTSGRFYIHENRRNGTFAPSGTDWGTGTTSIGSQMEVLVADFTGDGFADYADHDVTTGNLWVHENRRDRTFAPRGVNWAFARTAAGGSWQTLVGDFTGDGYADYADHDLTSGRFYIHENRKNGTFAPSGTDWGEGHSAVGANMEILGYRVDPAPPPPAPGGVKFGFPIGDKTTWPAGGGQVTQVLGHYSPPSSGFEGGHLAEDVRNSGGEAANANAPVYAVADGRVLVAHPNGSTYVNVILIEHDVGDGNTICSFYGHLGTLQVTAGQNVRRGDQIATLLDWQARFGQPFSHLHYVFLYPEICHASASLNGALICGYDNTRADNGIHDLSDEPAEYLSVGDPCNTNSYGPFIAPSQYIRAHHF